MEYFKEEDFYKNEGNPTEELHYCPYIFYQNTTSEWGRDYDQFALVTNAEYPYIRLTQKIGSIQTPCGGSSTMACDGHFASKTDEERDEECPKIAWGVAAMFVSSLRYDNSQQDYVLSCEKSKLIDDYYSRYLKRYMEAHSALKYAKISIEQKELDFLKEHIEIVKSFWAKSSPLAKYNVLYSYAKEFEEEYESFIEQRKRTLETIIMAGNKFSTLIASACGNEYVKVFFLDDSVATDARSVVEGLNTVRKVNITQSTSNDHPGATLTVYPKSMVTAKECEAEVKESLALFFSKATVGNMKPKNEARFREIEAGILDALDKAMAYIDVCVAWFTNDKLRDKLLEKQKDGVTVRVITFKDGVNKRHGVDFTGINHKEFRAERGGIMHEKFCVIDNVTVINGSYNWTTNAEEKNDEDAAFRYEDVKFGSSYSRRFNEIWKRDEQNDIIEIVD